MESDNKTQQIYDWEESQVKNYKPPEKHAVEPREEDQQAQANVKYYEWNEEMTQNAS